jgi:hypothetical protein
MSEEIIRALDLIEKMVHTGTDEITRALEVMEKRAHTPDIDAKELTLMLAYHMQLTFLLKGEQAIGDLITEEELSLLKAESLREGSKEDRQKGREQIERHKARLRETIEKDKQKVRKILEDAGMK